MTRHNRHNGLLPAPTCYGLVADLLRGSYGNTGVMESGLYMVELLPSAASLRPQSVCSPPRSSKASSTIVGGLMGGATTLLLRCSTGRRRWRVWKAPVYRAAADSSLCKHICSFESVVYLSPLPMSTYDAVVMRASVTC